MKLEDILCFSGVIGWFIRFVKRLFVTIRRGAIILFFRWPKNVAVTSLLIHDEFLLTNGILVIEWKLRNFLWIKINATIKSYNRNGIALNFDKVSNPLVIEVQGLFGKYKEEFPLQRNETLRTSNLIISSMNQNDFSIYGVRSSIQCAKAGKVDFKVDDTLTIELIALIDVIKIYLPPPEKVNHHGQNLL
jgi:hypothetical protein